MNKRIPVGLKDNLLRISRNFKKFVHREELRNIKQVLTKLGSVVGPTPGCGKLIPTLPANFAGMVKVAWIQQ